MRLLGDVMQWWAREMPRWHPISVSGYHIREAGSTPPPETAFPLPVALPRPAAAAARARWPRRRAVGLLPPPPPLLLQRPQRLLRGDRQVPGGAPHLGARDARHLRR